VRAKPRHGVGPGNRPRDGGRAAAHVPPEREDAGPRWWCTRADPFAEAWETIVTWLAADPARTAMALFLELDQCFPGRYSDGPLRTLQRRVQEWRARSMVVLDQQWLQEEVLVKQTLPQPVRVLTVSQDGAPASPVAASP